MLTVGEIVRSIRRKAELRFVVIDAAQAFAHVPLDDCLSVSDFTIAGCHKWLQGYFPLGLALYGQQASRDFIDLAKKAGCKFACGTNNGGADDLGSLEYSKTIIRQCGLTKDDFFTPRPAGQRAIDRWNPKR